MNGVQEAVDRKPAVAEAVERSLADNEKAISLGLRSFVEVGQALMEIRDRRQYKEAGFPSFDDYCRERWDLGRDAADDQIAASRVAVAVADAEHAPQSIRVARPLAALLDDQGEDAVREAWTAICEKRGDRPTGAQVRAFLNPQNASSSPSASPVRDAYLGPLEPLKKAVKGVRKAIEQNAGEEIEDQVCERYSVWAEDLRDFAKELDKVARGANGEEVK